MDYEFKLGVPEERLQELRTVQDSVDLVIECLNAKAFYATYGQPNRRYHNDGGRRFVDVTEHSGTGDTGWSLAMANYNGDGWPDLAVATAFSHENLLGWLATAGHLMPDGGGRMASALRQMTDQYGARHAAQYRAPAGVRNIRETKGGLHA